MSNFKEVHGKSWPHVSGNLLFGVWPMLHNSVAVAVAVAVVRTYPQAIPLALMTLRKSIQGFPFFRSIVMGLRFAVVGAAEAPL